MIRFLTEKELILINALVIRRYSPSEEIRVKDPALLDSAIHRPQQSVMGEDAYPDIWLKAAALYESIAKNHAFAGGNKRTAFAALYQFLRLNGLRLTVNEKEAEDFTVELVEKKPSLQLPEIADWIERNCEPNLDHEKHS